MMSKHVIVITGASSGFGALTARALAKAGHTVYAGIRATQTRNAKAVADMAVFAKDAVSTSCKSAQCRQRPRLRQALP